MVADMTSALGNLTKAVLQVDGHNLATVLPELLDRCEALDAVCVLHKAPSMNYGWRREGLLRGLGTPRPADGNEVVGQGFGPTRAGPVAQKREPALP